MSRMIDRLFKSPQVDASKLWGVLGNLPVIDVSNVFRYYEEQELRRPDKHRRSMINSFTLIPPFRHCWLESRVSHPGIAALGARLDLVPFTRNAFPSSVIAAAPATTISGGLAAQAAHFPRSGDQVPLTFDPEPKYILEGSAVIEGRNNEYYIEHTFSFPVTEEGAQSKGPGGSAIGSLSRDTGGSCPGDFDEAVFDFSDVICLALTFMHCKNVRIIDNEPDPPLQKKHLRTSTFPLVTYKTIQIEPAKHVLQSVGHIEENGLARALHICRGHFKVFDEHPLFGKIKGKFFWEEHVRGSAEAGIAVRDYRVRGPKARQS